MLGAPVPNQGNFSKRDEHSNSIAISDGPNAFIHITPTCSIRLIVKDWNQINSKQIREHMELDHNKNTGV